MNADKKQLLRYRRPSAFIGGQNSSRNRLLNQPPHSVAALSRTPPLGYNTRLQSLS
jgi:hypothetical protein